MVVINMIDSLIAFVYNILYYLAIGAVILAFSLYFFQNKMIYQPNPIMMNFPTPDLNPDKYKHPKERGIS